MRSMVVGATRLGLGQNRFHRNADVPQDVGGRDPKNLHAVCSEEGIASSIALWPIAHFVTDAVHLDRKLRLRAKEIRNERPRRVLAAKLEAMRSEPQLLP